MSCECGCGQSLKTQPYRKYLPLEHRKIWTYPKFIEGHNIKFLHATGELSPTYKGGKWIDDHGYVRINLGGSDYVYEHRQVWEDYHKACLLSCGAVHHKDGNKTNNDITNLEGMTKSTHNRVHNCLRNH